MLKEKELSDPNSCINKAKPGEMVFVLLARDAEAPRLVRDWARRRVDSGKNTPIDDQITEAYECAQEMERQQGRAGGPGMPGPAGPLKYNITVNGQQHNIGSDMVTYQDLKALAGFPLEIEVTITYWRKFHGGKESGTVRQGSKAVGCDKMNFSVAAKD